jgi:hypothetical protein
LIDRILEVKEHRGIIGGKAALYFVPKNMGGVAAFFDIPQGEAVTATIIDGTYELYIVAASVAEDPGGDAAMGKVDYIVYDLGDKVFTRKNHVVTLSLDKKPVSMSLKALMNELNSRLVVDVKEEGSE